MSRFSVQSAVYYNVIRLLLVCARRKYRQPRDFLLGDRISDMREEYDFAVSEYFTSERYRRATNTLSSLTKCNC